MPTVTCNIGERVTISIACKRTTGRVVSVEDAEHLKSDKRREVSGKGQILIVQPDDGPYVRVNANCVEE